MAKSFRTLAGIPDSTASTSDSVLLIIDAQNEYANGALAVSNLATSRPALEALYKKYKQAGGHVIHILHQVPEGTPVFTPGTDLAAEFPELAQHGPNESTVKKHFPGSFAETDLAAQLDAIGKKKLVLTGYMAHVCVSTTAREAAQRGYEVVVAGDAIGDRDIPGASGEEVRIMVLKELADFFATVIQSADVQ